MEVVLRGTADKQETVGEPDAPLNQHPDSKKSDSIFAGAYLARPSPPRFPDYRQIKGTAIQTKEEKKDGGQQ